MAEVGNGVKHSEPVRVPAGTQGEVVRSRGGYWVIIVDPESTNHPTMVVIDAWETDPYSVVEPYGVEANHVGVGAGFERWAEQRYPVGQSVTFKSSVWGRIVDEDGDERRVPVLPESEGIIRDRQDGYTYIEVVRAVGVAGAASVVLTYEQLMDCVEPDSRNTLQENRYDLGRNAQKLPSKSLRPIVKKARKQGWDVSVTKKSHVRFVPPGSGNVIIASGSASDVRSLKNLRARLRRAGLDI